jgi:hypothetical protein
MVAEGMRIKEEKMKILKALLKIQYRKEAKFLQAVNRQKARVHFINQLYSKTSLWIC